MHVVAYINAWSRDSGGAWRQSSRKWRNVRQITLMQNAHVSMNVTIVPMKRCALSRSPAPRYCAMTTCPAPEKPIAMKFRNFCMSPPTDMDESPTRPNTCPITIISTVL